MLRACGTICTYANDGGKPVELNVPQNMVLNTRLQFLVLNTAGALPVGEEHGLPLIRFPLQRTADAHRALENGAVGKVLVDVTPRRPMP